MNSTHYSKDLIELQKRLQVPLNPELKEDFDFFLKENEEGFFSLQSKAGLELQIDFDKNRKDYHRQKISKKDLLPRAIGIGKGVKKVLDLTAGLGIDAVHMVQLGLEVCSAERDPVLFFLLSQALKKSSRPELKKLRFVLGEALQILESKISDSSNSIDVIYFDPMYPGHGGSALPRKEMQLFRQWVGEDEDSESVFEKILQMWSGRIVVKRPLRSSPWFHEHPRLKSPPLSFSGKTVRYDVYWTKEDAWKR